MLLSLQVVGGLPTCQLYMLCDNFRHKFDSVFLPQRKSVLLWASSPCFSVVTCMMLTFVCGIQENRLTLVLDLV